MPARKLIDLIRWAPWMTRDRALSYLRVWIVLQFVFAVIVAGSFLHTAASHGKPQAMDLSAFWAAAHLALAGRPEAVYDADILAAFEHAHLWLGDDPAAQLPFLYPPTFLVLVLPMGLLAYAPAMAAFLASLYALFGASLRLVTRLKPLWLALILSPAMLMNTIIGQNGAFTAACFAAAMGLLEPRPALAGAALGMLVCKPHFALAIPIALALAGRWRAFFACALTAASVCLISLALFGPATWLAFFRHANEARTVLEHHPELLSKIQSVFSGIRLLGGSLGAGYAGYGVAAIASLAVLAMICRRRPGGPAEIAVLVTVSLFCSPYMLDYDMTCLLLPLAYLTLEALRSGWLAWEKSALMVLYLLPMVARILSGNLSLPLVPPMMAILLALCARRALRQNQTPKGMIPA